MKQIRVIKGLLLLLLSAHFSVAFANESGSSNSTEKLNASAITRAGVIDIEFTQEAVLSALVSGGVVTTAPALTLKREGVLVTENVSVTIGKDASDTRNWHTSNATKSSDTGTFTFDTLGFINPSEQDVVDPIISVTVKDGTGATIGELTKKIITGAIKKSESTTDPIRSIRFNSNDNYMSLGNLPQMGADGMKAFTFEAWIKVNGKSDNRYIFQYGEQSEDKAKSFLSVRVYNGNNGTLRTAMHDGKGESIWAYTHGKNWAYFDYEKWTHFAVSFDLETSYLRFYKNGEEVDSVNSFNRHTAFPSNAGEFRIARGNTDGALWAEFDEVRLWKKALTEADIKKNIYRPIENPSNEADLIGYYRCDALVDKETDLSLYGNHATYHNSSASNRTDSKALGFPSDLKVKKGNGASMIATWSGSPVAPGNLDYEITVYNDETLESMVSTTTATGTSVQLNGLDAGKIYYVQVKARYTDGNKLYYRASDVLRISTGSIYSGAGSSLELVSTDGADNDTAYVGFKALNIESAEKTLSFWFKNGKNNRVINDILVGDNSKVSIDNEGNIILFTNEVATATKAKIESEKWTHITLVTKSDQVNVYCNGMQVATVDKGFSFNFKQIGSKDNRINCQIDELTIWNKALTQDKIKSTLLFRNPSSTDEGLVLYNGFEGADGISILIDSSANGYDANTYNALGNITTLTKFYRSEAWDRVIVFGATNVTSNNFTANWEGDPNKIFVLQVSKDKTFTDLNSLLVSQENISSLNLSINRPDIISAGNIYYYRAGYSVADINDVLWSDSVIAVAPTPNAPGVALQVASVENSLKGVVAVDKDERISGAALKTFTIESWVMNNLSDGLGTLTDYRGIFGSRTTSIDSDSTPFVAVCGTDYKNVTYGFSNGGVNVSTTTEAIFPKNQWVHLALTFDGKIITLFINGNAVSQLGSKISPSPSAYFGVVGKLSIPLNHTRSVVNEFAFTGQIDEVRVWNYARSLEQIEADMYREINPSSEGLLLNYRFADLGDSDAVIDSSLNGINGFVVEKKLNDRPWRSSYAMVRVPMLNASDIKENGFTINWGTPTQGVLPSHYLIYVSSDTSFENLVGGYAPHVVSGENRSLVVANLDPKNYYYKVLAANADVISDSMYEGFYPIKSTDSEIFTAYLNKTVAPGNRLFFDGNMSFAKMPQTGKLALGTSSMSIEFWMKSGFKIASTKASTIISNKKDSLKDAGYAVRFDSKGAISFQVNDKPALVTPNAVNDNKWHHIACILDRDLERAFIYIDGKLAAEQENNSKTTLTSPLNIHIGATDYATSHTSFRGELDELRIWNSAITSDDILKNMHVDLLSGKLPLNLVSYLLFDEEGKSNTINNEVIGAPNATLVNAFNSKYSSYYKTWDKSFAMGAVENLVANNYRADQFSIKWDAPSTLTTDHYLVTVTDSNDNPVSGPTNINNVTSTNITKLTSGNAYKVKVEGVVSETNRVITSEKLLIASPSVINQPGNALEFPKDTKSYVHTSPLTFSGQSQLSFDTWVCASEDMSIGKAPLLYTKARITDSAAKLEIGINRKGTEYYPYFTWFKTDETSVTDLPKLNVNEWYHLAVSFDLAADKTLTVKIYLTDSTGTVTISESTHAGASSVELFESLYLGNVPQDVEQDRVQFVGKIDDVRLWNETLTKEKVDTLYSAPMNINAPIGKIIAAFQMDQPTDSKYATESISALNAQIVGSEEINRAKFVPSGAFNSRPILLPSTNLTETSITINWSLVPNLSEGDTIKVILRDKDGNVVAEKLVGNTDTSVIFENLDYGVYTAVVVVNKAGGSSSESNPSLVTTKSKVPGLALVSKDELEASILVEKPIFGVIPEEFTVEFWCRLDKLGADGFSVIAKESKESSALEGFTFKVTSETGAIEVGTNKETNISQSNFIEYGNPLNTGVPTYPVWQHIAFTYKNGAANLLRNGVVVASAPKMASSSLWNVLQISKLKGAIDELRIWSVARNVDEISENMFTEVATNSFGLELYYAFDHLKSYTGDVVDLSGNGRSGTSTNANYLASYAMVQPIDVSCSSTKIDENNVSLSIGWKDSNILPIIARTPATAGNSIINTKTQYVIFLSKDVDFSTMITDPIIVNSATPVAEISGSAAEGYKFTPNKTFSGSETIYCRIVQSDNVTGSFHGDSYEDLLLAYSAFSNISVLFSESVQPGNMLAFSKHWPIYVDVTPKFGIDSVLGKMTVETWVKTTQSATNVPVLATKQIALATEPGFIVSLKNGKPTLNMGDGEKSTEFVLNKPINDGKWHHIAFAIDAGSNTVTGYVDGVSNASSLNGVNPSSISNIAKLIIGQDLSTTYADGFIGEIDELRVFNDLRSTQELNDFAIKAPRRDDPNLVLYYSFNQSSGNVIFDQSQTPTNGFIVGEIFDVWQQSNALSAAQPIDPTISSASFTARWTTSNSVNLKGYELIISNNPGFKRSGTEFVQTIAVGKDTSYDVSVINDTDQTELVQPGKGYFYKVNTIFVDPIDKNKEIILESVPKSLTTSIERGEAGNALDMVQNETRFAFSTISNAFKSPAITASAWVKPRLTNTSWGTIMCGVGGSTETSIDSMRWAVYLNHNSLKEIRFEVGASGFSFNYTMIPENWYYITAVFTPEGAKLYVNGVIIGDLVHSLPLPSANNVERIQVGANNGTGRPFMGIVDEVRIWNYAQNITEINADKVFELSGLEDGLIGYYKYNHRVSNVGFNTVVAVDSSKGYNHQLVDLKMGSVNVEAQNGWVESYALGTPEAKTGTDFTYSSFNANFDAPSVIRDSKNKPTNYILEVSKSSSFTNIVTDMRSLPGNKDNYSTLIDRLLATTAEANGLLEGTNYFYRARYELSPGIFRTSEAIQATTQFVGAGNGLLLSGEGQYVDLANQGVLKGDKLKEFTVMLWVKPRDIDETTNGLTEKNTKLSGIVGSDSNSSNGTTITLGAPTLAIINDKDLVYGYGVTNQDIMNHSIKDVFTQPRWYHVAMTLSGSRLTVYVDGVQFAQVNESPLSTFNNNYINYLGRFNNSNDYCYSGGIDEFRVYSRALSQQEVISDAFRPIVPGDSFDESSSGGLAYYLQLNQASGTKMTTVNVPGEESYTSTIVGSDPSNLPSWIQVRDDKVIIDGVEYNFAVPSTYIKMRTTFASRKNNFAETDYVTKEGYAISPTATTASNDVDEYVISGLIIRPDDKPNKYYTTTAGLSSNVKSTQLLKQSIFTRNNLPVDGATITVEFNLYDLSPAIYNIDYVGEDYSGLSSLEKKQIRERFLSAASDEFQLLWSPKVVTGTSTNYVDITTLDQIQVEKKIATGSMVRDSNNREDYTIRFTNVPAWVTNAGVKYNTGVFTLGTSIPLDEVILTPAVGLKSEISINADGDALISWSVAEEAGVREYAIERQNSDGSWSTIAVVVPNGKSLYEFLDENYQDGNLYRIVVIDVYGSKQVFAVNSDKQTWYITVNKGWNLLSLPCVDADITELEKLAEGYFWEWKDGVYEIIRSAPEGLKGFWIYNDGKERIVEITGKSLKRSQTKVIMSRGWNIYGPSENTYIPANIDSVYTWDTDESYQEILSDKKILMVTRAYWFFNLDENLEVELGRN